MRSTYGKLQILVIDEISMVGAETLSNLDQALQDIFENDSPFRELSVLAVGDELANTHAMLLHHYKGALTTTLYHHTVCRYF